MVPKKMFIAISFLILSGVLVCGCSSGSTPSNPSSSSSSEKSSAAGKKRSPSKDENGSSSGSGQPDSSSDSGEDHTGTPRDNTPEVLTPEASGSLVLGNDFIAVDASHAEDGYIMVQYTGSNDKVKLRVTGPDQAEYIYLLSDTDGYETFPLTCGSGSYQIQVLENAGDDMYAVAYSGDVDVSIRDEHSPFLYPNQYVNFAPDSQAVAKGSELAEGVYSDLEAVENIYDYVIGEIVYDEEKAASVTYGYLPSVDETLSSGRGICFDYAALMSAMLRSQRIPTKLQVGYSGEAYHAWISVYVKESGWVDDIIQFDGKSWTLMDPTLGANNSSSSVQQYIGDGSNYVEKFSY